MANGTITIRTHPALAKKINALAKATDRSRNWLVEEALKQYIATHAWQIEGIKQAQRSLAKGKGHSFESVMVDLQAKIDRKMKGLR